MWFRFLVISFLNVVATGVAIVGLAGFILPEKTPSAVLVLSVWLIAFLTTYLFSNWALSKRLPTRQDSLHLIMMHLLVFVTIYLTYGIFISDRGPWVIVSPELLAQLAVEVFAVFLSAYRMRRSKIKSVLGEGMSM